MDRQILIGHLALIFTVAVWGTTFVSTKILLTELTPLEILFYRFLLGAAALTIAYPHFRHGGTWRDEGLLALAGLTGITLYYLFENIALDYSTASNVSVIIVTTPLFTGILARIILKELLRPAFLWGFCLAAMGIVLIEYGNLTAEIHPLGDILALLASFIWGVYSVIIRQVSASGIPITAITQRVFYYGILFMVPALFFFEAPFDLALLENTTVAGHLIFLGLGASALCFATWNFGVQRLGAVTSGIYIYWIPIISIIMAAVVLDESLSFTAIIGMGLTMAGVILSQSSIGTKRHS